MKKNTKIRILAAVAGIIVGVIIGCLLFWR